MPEDWKYRRRRARLVEELRRKGIQNEHVLQAIGAVPRHLFMDAAWRPKAYEDKALPIGLGQTISQPFTVAYQTMELAPAKDERILEVGTGSGYQAAVLREMGARIFSIERHKQLLDRTSHLLRELGYRVRLKCGDGTFGWPAFAPYDGIIVTAAAAAEPEALLEQLREPRGDRPGGRLIVPIGTADGQSMYRIERTGPESFRRERMDGFRFVPLIGQGGGGF
jgi:protein-L-isoaspartate(D-aspartate) O-methyltransferase